MSPIRKSDDYRATQIDSWDEYIEDEIAEMQARGEFDNLPDRGKPIKIWKTDVNPEYDLAFSRMKNAGVKPAWMELDAEISQRTEELWARLDAVEQGIRALLEQLKSTPSSSQCDKAPEGGLWHRFVRWFRWDLKDDTTTPPPTIASIMDTRDRERKKFLDLAAELDKKISTYHDSLPQGGDHLQRLPWRPERAERIFDERIALTDWWEEVRAELS